MVWLMVTNGKHSKHKQICKYWYVMMGRTMFSFIILDYHFMAPAFPRKLLLLLNKIFNFSIFLQKNRGYSCEALRNDKKSFDSTTEL